MESIVQISMLGVAIAILVLVIIAIPILLDLRRIVKNWKKVSEIIELGIAPIVWSASFILDIVKKVIDIGTEKKKEDLK